MHALADIFRERTVTCRVRQDGGHFAEEAGPQAGVGVVEPEDVVRVILMVGLQCEFAAAVYRVDVFRYGAGLGHIEFLARDGVGGCHYWGGALGGKGC